MDVLLGQPAAWTVPLALATMVVVSLLTRSRVPGHAGRFMVRLHTPETVAARPRLIGPLVAPNPTVRPTALDPARRGTAARTRCAGGTPQRSYGDGDHIASREEVSR